MVLLCIIDCLSEREQESGSENVSMDQTTEWAKHDDTPLSTVVGVTMVELVVIVHNFNHSIFPFTL